MRSDHVFRSFTLRWYDRRISVWNISRNSSFSESALSISNAFSQLPFAMRLMRWASSSVSPRFSISA